MGKKKRARVIHARLDEKSQELLEVLQKHWGDNTSEVIREALRVLAAVTPQAIEDKVVGLGQFSSGQPDLGSNKEHLKGFGSKESL